MKRLVAVAVRGKWAGEWQMAQGNELSAAAAPIGKGEAVWLEMVIINGEEVITRRLLLSAVPTELKGKMQKYRIVKDSTAAEELVATTVELYLSNRSRAA